MASLDSSNRLHRDDEFTKSHLPGQELEEGLVGHQPAMAALTRTGEQIIGQLSSPDGSLLEEKLDVLAQRWRAVGRQVGERQRR